MQKNLTILGIVIILVLGGAYHWLTSQAPTTAGGFNTQVSGGGAQPHPSLTPATTTPCAIPVSATSSIQHFAITVTTGTSSAGTMVVGTSTSKYATSTTPFATFTIPANSQFTYAWNGSVNNDVASPGTYIVGGMSNGSDVGYGYTYGGSCSTVLLNDN